MHGGLFSEDGVTLEDLRKIDRNRQPPDSGRVRLGVQCTISIKLSLERNRLQKGKREHFNTFLRSFTGPMCDLLWSDPQPQVSYHPPNTFFRSI